MLERSSLSRLILVVLVEGIPLFAQSSPAVLKSPDGRLMISFETVRDHANSSDAGQLVYSVTYRGKPLITPSALQLHLGSHPLGPNVQLVKQTDSQMDETYRLVTGKTSIVRNHYNALRLQTEERSGL
jgi:alpha-glucosidase